jgi:plasmid stability protein
LSILLAIRQLEMVAIVSLRRLDVIASNRYIGAMTTPTKRSTVYFDPVIHRALRLKAAEMDRSVSDLVNDAVKASLAEDAEDLAAFEERATEPNLSFEQIVKDLKRSGKI